MRVVFLILLACSSFCFAQSDPEDFHIEVGLFAWRTGVEGTLQSGIIPVDLRQDLNLQDRLTFFGKLVAKPARKHRILIEGSPYSFDGRNALSRTIQFNNRTYNIQDVITSKADLTYFFGGYQYDIVSRPRGNVGVQVGGAYLDATGTIASESTGLSATRTEQLGLPLAGMEFRGFLIPSVLSVSGEVKGMAFGDYGHFVQATILAGAGWHGIWFQAGYQILDADIHEARNTTNPGGIAPRFRGPIFGLQFRK